MSELKSRTNGIPASTVNLLAFVMWESAPTVQLVTGMPGVVDFAVFDKLVEK